MVYSHVYVPRFLSSINHHFAKGKGEADREGHKNVVLLAIYYFWLWICLWCKMSSSEALSDLRSLPWSLGIWVSIFLDQTESNMEIEQYYCVMCFGYIYLPLSISQPDFLCIFYWLLMTFIRWDEDDASDRKSTRSLMLWAALVILFESQYVG